MVIAHRGASGYAPENTFAAFDKAVELGIADAELDVQLSKDGHIVVIHDATVDRTTNGSGAVAEMTLAELQALDAGAPPYGVQRIPTLDQVLARYAGRLRLHVELKADAPDLARRTAELVRGHRVIITSFHAAQLEEVAAYAPEVPTGWLVQGASDAILVDAARLGVTQLCPRGDLITRELVDHLHGSGFVVRAWGVTSDEIMRRVIDAGADGMTLDYPDRAVPYLKRRG